MSDKRPPDIQPVPAGTIRTGLIGSDIQASGSPRMHLQEARENNLQLTYELLDLDHAPEGAAALERVLLEAEGAGFSGVNVTHPCKQRVIQYLHELSEMCKPSVQSTQSFFPRGDASDITPIGGVSLKASAVACRA